MAIWSKKFDDQINTDIPLSTPLDELNLLVIDTETTGFAVGKDDRLIEVGAVPVKGLKVLEKESFQSYVNPVREIPPAITDLTSIRQSDVEDAPDAMEVIEALFEKGKQLETHALAGHYISFDLLVFKHELRRNSLRYQEPPAIDTLDLLSYLVPTWEMKDLAYYASVFETRMYDRHTALGDAMTAAYLFCELCERVKERGITTWGELLALRSSRTP
ncbi:3'-5' exonuclease [Jeotgalibacillus haloalkalitolerans]|uniref:3'-5' exonuclease n=1 Tax=Jeotgalibacillus haloalkalitolerans TaxID=3104292 RepID=A0ABU5KJK0_9BACL|nr:3'-5' exonuclease [Jeotgalibacillus sp. HH7-29]MDZ5711101.1 3'-5' exonuclease [Jeotgalibacillus sp. HH7-29]